MSHFDQTIDAKSALLPVKSLQLLRHCVSRSKRQMLENPDDQIISHASSSTASIMKSAKEKLLQLKSQNAEFIISSVFSLGFQVSQEIALTILLQAAAEKVENQQYVDARKLLRICRKYSCKNGNSPTQRLAYYFVEALYEKTDRECGIILETEEEEQKQRKPIPMDVKMAFINLQPEIMAAQQENPFSLVTQFMTAGSIRETMASAKKVHILDFSIDNGSQWTPLMQDFAARNDFPVEILKITAVGTSKSTMEETGKHLSSFADSINLPFSFNAVVIPDLKEFKGDSLSLEEDEAVAVYVATRFWTLLAWPNYLEKLIETIKSLKPKVMVVKELEASTNKSSFLERFDEALIFLSGIFDIEKDCMENHVKYRNLSEEFMFGKMIRNIVTAEGPQRIHRHERIGFWRSLFRKFDIEEKKLSRSSFRKAKLLLKRSARFSSFTVYKDGKSAVLGWKGTPFLSVSAWKFPNE